MGARTPKKQPKNGIGREKTMAKYENDYRPLLAAAIKEGRAQLKVIEKRRKELVEGGFDKDLANSSAALMRALTSATGEMRQQEKHAAQMVARMSQEERDELVLEFISAMDKERLNRVRAHLDSLLENQSVLG